MLGRIISLLLSIASVLIITLMFVLDKCNTFGQGTFACVVGTIGALSMLFNIAEDI